MQENKSERLLILTADDFGASTNINEGIRFAAEKKAITGISALTNFPESLAELKEISEKHPDIGIGVHLNIVTGEPILDKIEIPSLVAENGSFYPLDDVIRRIDKISLDELKKELKAQILALKDIDIRIDHLSDQCGILSLHNPFFDITTELALEFDVPVRSPSIASVKYPTIFSSKEMNKKARKKALKLMCTCPIQAFKLFKGCGIKKMEKKIRALDELSICHPDLMVDCFWGDPSASNLLLLLEKLPQGTSEIILHFGSFSRQEHYPSGLDIDYFKNRENELITLTSSYLNVYYTHLNIKLIGYSDIPRKTN